MTPLQALEALENRRSGVEAPRTTGFVAIDEVTGGFGEGQVWILLATPGQGRSTLATQWALLLSSAHGLDTLLVSPRDPVTLIGARLAASAGKVPALRLWVRGLSESDGPRAERVREVLGSARLQIAGPGELTMLDVVGDETSVEVLVVDDADMSAGVSPERVATFARQGVLVILTLPRSAVITPAGVDLGWSRVADFVIDLERPDFLDQTSRRPGEADLHLLRNRWGPDRVARAAFQGHYSRFVDMPR